MTGVILRRQYFCICEGQQEEMYMSHLSKLLKTDKRVVKFATKRGLPGDIVRVGGFKPDKAVLFDHDGEDTTFRNGLKECLKAKCAYAYSNRNFDLWLLLHKQYFAQRVSTNNAYADLIRNSFNLDKTTKIKNKDTIKIILDQITLEDVRTAISRAERIREHKKHEDGRQEGSAVYYGNPDLYIHEFIKRVFLDCGESLAFSKAL